MRTERHVGGEGQPEGTNACRHTAASVPVSASTGCWAGARPSQTRSYTAGLPACTSSSWCEEAAVDTLLMVTTDVFLSRDWLLRVVK